MLKPKVLHWALAAWSALLMASLAPAQDAGERRGAEAPAAEDAEAPRHPLAIVGLSGTWRPESRFDDASGKVAYTDAEVWIRSHVPVSGQAALMPMLSYRHTNFSWRRGHDFLPRGNPWTDLHRLALDADLRYQFSDELTGVVGAGIGVAGEGKALSDGWFGSTRASLIVDATDDISVGMGLRWSYGLEDLRFFPLPFFRWQITEVWRLSTQRGGLRLGYAAAETLDFGAFGGYERRRWRLGSSGTPRRGYAQLSGARLGVDARWDIKQTVALQAEVGADLARRLSAEDRRERRVARDKLDAAPFFGLGLNVGF